MNTEIVEESVCVRVSECEKVYLREVALPTLSCTAERFQLQTSVKRRQQTSFRQSGSNEQLITDASRLLTAVWLQLGPGEFPEGGDRCRRRGEQSLHTSDSKPCVFPTEVVPVLLSRRKNKDGWKNLAKSEVMMYLL